MIYKKRFIHNALILTVITFLLRLISTAFGIYVSNKLSSEGMGLYQLAGSVYQFAVTFCISGITVAITRIVAQQFAQNNEMGAQIALNRCLLYGLIFSLFSAFLLYFCAPFICNSFLHENRIIRSLQYLAFSLPFLSLAAILRGYFMGAQKTKKAASGDIVEQIAFIVFTIPILNIALPKGLESASCGLVIASVFSEAISCLYVFILYSCEKKQNTGEKPKALSKQIFEIAAPIAVSNYIRSALLAFENSLTPIGLCKYGMTKCDALSQYGMVKGMVMPILFFPSAVLSAFSGMLIPEVSGANAVNKKARIAFIINKCLQATLLFAFLVMGFFFCFSNEISMALYNDEKIGKILLAFTPLVPLLYLDQIVDSILKGLNQQVSAMKYNTADSCFRLLLVLFLVPICGLKGYIFMFYFGTIFNALMSIRRLLTISHVKFLLKKWVLLPVISILISCFVIKLIGFYSFFIKVVVFILVYILFLMLFSCVKKSDIKFILRVFAIKK